MCANPLIPSPSDTPGLPRWSEHLHDHRHVVIRPLLRRDRPAERAFLQSQAGNCRVYESLYQGDADAAKARVVTLMAVTPQDAAERTVGLARYVADGTSCQAAVLVDEDWQSHGLATLLVQHLMDIARIRGLRRMCIVDSVENLRLQSLARDLRFVEDIDPEQPWLARYERSLASLLT